MKELVFIKLSSILILLTFPFFSCGNKDEKIDREKIVSQYLTEKEKEIVQNNWYLVKYEIDSTNYNNNFDILDEIRFNYSSYNSYFIFRSGEIKKALSYSREQDLMIYSEGNRYDKKPVIVEEESKIIFYISGDTLKYGNKHGRFYYQRKR